MECTPSLGSATIVVLGMHRSGTSLLARLLDLAGCDFGPRAAIAAPAEDNPRGFWEHLGLRRVNDDLLALFGGSWLAPPEFPAGWLADPRLAALRARVREIVARDFAGRPLWGFKDPRTSLAAPFWRAALPTRIHWVLAVRDPREVAASLRRRDGIPPALAEDLWCESTRRALAGAPECAHAIVPYEHLLADPVGTIERLLAALGLRRGPLDAERRAALAAEARPELRHHHAEPREASSLGAATLALHRSLLAGMPAPPAASLEGGAPPQPGFRAMAAAFGRELAARRELSATLADREADLRRALDEAARWRERAQELGHCLDLERRRPESRAGEALRRCWRALRSRQPSPGPAGSVWRTREDSNL